MQWTVQQLLIVDTPHFTSEWADYSYSMYSKYYLTLKTDIRGSVNWDYIHGLKGTHTHTQCFNVGLS